MGTLVGLDRIKSKMDFPKVYKLPHKHLERTRSDLWEVHWVLQTEPHSPTRDGHTFRVPGVNGVEPSVAPVSFRFSTHHYRSGVLGL